MWLVIVLKPSSTEGIPFDTYDEANAFYEEIRNEGLEVELLPMPEHVYA